MKINPQYFTEHETSCNPRLQRDITAIIRSALGSCDPSTIIRKHLSRNGKVIQAFDQKWVISDNGKVYVCALGKAAIPMISSTKEILGEEMYAGLAVTKVKSTPERYYKNIRVLKGDHPLPGKHSEAAADEVIEFLHSTSLDDLVIFLVSGGGSALVSKPAQGITMMEMQQLTSVLLNASVPIHEINILRKHLDTMKGGGLLHQALPANTLTLILSDVVGNQLASVASGPTLPDISTYYDCLRIISERSLMDLIPPGILKYLRDGSAGSHLETLKPNEYDISRHKAYLVGSLQMAIKAAADSATKMGYSVITASNYLQKDAEMETNRIMEQFADMVNGNPPQKTLMIWGGEVTVQRVGSNWGGRNLHMALLLSEAIAEMDGVSGITFATDGEDGSTDAAGAFFDSHTHEKAKKAGLLGRTALESQDSYHYFDTLGDLIVTGSTETNVNDMIMLLKE